MWPLGPLTLEGDVVRLEPLALAHVDALAAVGMDEDLWRWTLTRIRDRADMETYVRAALDEQARGVSLPFATVDRASGLPIGSTRFGNMDAPNRRVEIGWTWLARAHQRTAANTEAKFLMLEHAFEVLGCVRVELKTDELNERSRRAIERIGARFEGVLRNHMITPGGRLRNTAYYSILEDEWPAVKAMLEARIGRPHVSA